MIRNAIIHVQNEQPLLADLYEMPSALDQGLLCTNLRMLDGKRPASEHIELLDAFRIDRPCARDRTSIDFPMRFRAHVQNERVVSPLDHVVELRRSDARRAQRPVEAPAGFIDLAGPGRPATLGRCLHARRSIGP